MVTGTASHSSADTVSHGVRGCMALFHLSYYYGVIMISLWYCHGVIGARARVFRILRGVSSRVGDSIANHCTVVTRVLRWRYSHVPVVSRRYAVVSH
jgi:hypothetical protein